MLDSLWSRSQVGLWCIGLGDSDIGEDTLSICQQSANSFEDVKRGQEARLSRAVSSSTVS